MSMFTFFKVLKKGFNNFDISHHLTPLISQNDEFNDDVFFKYLNDNAITANDFIFLCWYWHLMYNNFKSLDYNFIVRNVERAAHLEPTNIFAQFYIAQCTLHGTGTSENSERAFELAKKFSETGNYLCQYLLACYFYKNVKRDNYVKAFVLIQSAALNGHIYAQMDLALWYELGIGTVKDSHKAIYWHVKKHQEDNQLDSLNCIFRQNKF
ncbi:4177_t:CDS:2 [Ambispora gerdemannii]|uniref:4177_t:CDS:1 n=1 Tax=Ambispora gerdemannii TaxID=144530 RepID=A0A9N9ABY8_9GLOM|nr:4177_t:CDS:2 [Ambispora gerdemannii]